MKAGIGNAGPTSGRRHRQGGKGQNQQRMDDDSQCGQLHLAPLNLLAQIFGGTPYHQPADEHRQNSVKNHVHQTHALAAKDAVEHHVHKRHHAAQRRQCVMHVIDRTGGEGCSYRGKQRGLGDAEADLLAFHAARGLSETDLGQRRIALLFRPVAKA